MSETRIREQVDISLSGCTAALDVGCGPGKYLNTAPVQRKAGIDAYGPYLVHVENALTYHGRAEEVLPTLATGSFDLVFSLDFIEHLDKDVSIRVIKEMIRIAKVRVLLFTPDGFHPQHEEQADGHRLSHAEWEWQTHRSAWSVSDLEQLGFRAWATPFHLGNVAGENALWAVLEK